MKVSQRMTHGPITAAPKMTHREAMKLMEDHNIRRLPVIDRNRKLVGMISMSDLLSTAPSKATTLSVWEIYTLLDKLTVDQIMSKPVLAVEEDCSLAGAAAIMLENRISALPVVRGAELVGIITETDIFKTFVEVLGGHEPGCELDLKVVNEPGMLAKVAQAFASAGSNIVSLTTFPGSDTEYAILSVKERCADEAALRAALEVIDGVEIVDFRPGGHDRVIPFGD